MRLWISTCFATALIATSAAFAEPTPIEDGGTKGEQTDEVATPVDETAEKALPNCDEIEGEEEKAKCLELHEQAAAKEAAREERKGGKAQRSNTNRMEADNTDE